MGRIGSVSDQKFLDEVFGTDPQDSDDDVTEAVALEAIEKDNSALVAQRYPSQNWRRFSFAGGVAGTLFISVVAGSVLPYKRGKTYVAAVPILLGILNGTGLTVVVSALPEGAEWRIANVEAVAAISFQYFTSLFFLAKGCPWEEGFPNINWMPLWDKSQNALAKQWGFFAFSMISAHIIGISMRTGYIMEKPEGKSKIRKDPLAYVWGYSILRLVKGVHSKNDSRAFLGYQAAKVVSSVGLIVGGAVGKFPPATIAGCFIAGHMLGTVGELGVLSHRNRHHAAQLILNEKRTWKDKTRDFMETAAVLSSNTIWGVLISIPTPGAYGTDVAAGVLTGAIDANNLYDMETTEFSPKAENLTSHQWVHHMNGVLYTTFLAWMTLGIFDPKNTELEIVLVVMQMALPIIAYLGRTYLAKKFRKPTTSLGRWAFYQLFTSETRLATLYMVARSLGAAGSNGLEKGTFRIVWNVFTLSLFHIAWGNCQAALARKTGRRIPVDPFAQMLAGWIMGLALRGCIGDPDDKC